MQLSVVFVLLVLCLATVLALPISDSARVSRDAGAASEKRQTKSRSGYIRFGKRRVDPNAELLYLDQLLI